MSTRVEAEVPPPIGGGALFQRGDVDGRAGLALGDAVAIIDAVISGRALDCRDAGDVDDDGALRLSDSVRLLDHLFRGGPPPVSPFPACGPDLTPDGLDCERPPAGCVRDAELVSMRITARESTALPSMPGSARAALLAAGGRLVEIDRIVNGEILAHSQLDVYSFDVEPGRSVTVDRIASSNVNGLGWSLADPRGVVIASDNTLDDLGPVALIGGRYTLTIIPAANATGSYEFRVADTTPIEEEIRLDERITGEIDVARPGQNHVFLFDAPAGARVHLDAEGLPSRLTWTLEDALGRAIIPTRTIGEYDPVTLMGGRYRLTIASGRSLGELTIGPFDFRISSLPAPGVEALTLGAITPGEIAAPGEVDIWTFSVPSETAVYCDVVSTSGLITLTWELVGAYDRVIASSSNFTDLGEIELSGGDYFVRILGKNSTGVGDYSIRVSEIAHSTEDVSVGDEVSGEVPEEAPGSFTTYEFTATPGQLITLQTLETSNLGGLGWLLEDARGRAVHARTNLVTSPQLVVAGGDYSLTVTARNDATGTYRFLIRDDGIAPLIPPGASVAFGDTVDGALAPGGEARYTFPAVAGQHVFVDLLDGDSDLDWSLVDPYGGVLSSSTATFTGSDHGPLPLDTGDYTVVLVARNETAAPSFRFRIADATPLEDDVEIGEELRGDFDGAPGRIDRYRFPATEGQRVLVDRLDSGSLWLTLTGPGGEIVQPTQFNSGSSSDAGPFTLVAGTHTLILDPNGDQQPSYEIALRLVEDDEGVAPLDIELTEDFTDRPGATRTHFVDAIGGQRLFFDSRSSVGSLNWSLFDPVGQPLFESARFSRDQGPFTLAAGRYELILDPPSSHEPIGTFEIVAVDDTVEPLVLGTPIAGSLARPASTATYTLDAVEGQRLFFDLESGASSLRWSLLDEIGTAVFEDVAATSAATDMGPLSLGEGSYELVFSSSNKSALDFAFAVFVVPADLSVAELDVTPDVIFEGDDLREISVAWTVENLGGGPAPTGAWVDRLVLSADAVIGNDDDVSLGEYVRFDTIEPGSFYTREETVRLPADLELGQHRFYLLVDADHAIVEPGGEGDNVEYVEVQVVEDLPPAEPDFITTTTFPFEFEALGTSPSIDIPLSRPVSLDSVRFVLVESLQVNLLPTSGLSFATDITIAFLNGKDEVIEVASRGITGGILGSAALRFERRFSPAVAALLPTRTVDGLRIRLEQPTTTKTTLRAAAADGRLRVHFPGCEFDPCGPHVERRTPDAESVTISSGASDWQVIDFQQAVSCDGLRLVSGPLFTVQASGWPIAPSASSEVQLILDDGELLTLDDSRSPSTLAPPAHLSADHSYLFDDDTHAGRWIIGMQWRLQMNRGGTGVLEPVDELAVRFLYEVDACRGSVDIPPVEVTPADGAAFAPGSLVTISGRALPIEPGRPVSEVLVNGQAVDSVDAAGRFFKTVEIREGENLFAIEVVEPICGSAETLLKLIGVTDGAFGLDGYTEGTARLDVEYADTTFLRSLGALVVRARARNVSTHPVRAPILMAITGTEHPSVTLRDPAGVTDEGEPFVVILETGTLAPGEAGPYVPLVFSNPERRSSAHGVRFLVPEDRAPEFGSTPPASAVIDREYRYAPVASDPDGDGVEFELDLGPAGMTLDASGVLLWTPRAADAGTYDVALAAIAAGARTVQRWTLTVGDAAPNRPPFFETFPPTGAGVGARWVYDASAHDPDGDSLRYELIDGPAGMSVDEASGLVTWDYALPGEHRVLLSVSDTSGAAAAQAFILVVGSIPSNPSAPRISTTPSATARPGVLFVYQPVASDPDGDELEFALDVAPPDMTIDIDGGRVEWLPSQADAGTHDVTLSVRDGRGGETFQSFTILVGDGGSNLPPVVESVPAGHAVAGALYVYDADAIDPDGGDLAFALAGAPAGMTIDPATGLVEWTPGAGDAGTHLITIEVTDSAGGVGRQAFELRVRDSNVAPGFVTEPAPSTLIAGQVFQIDLDADDDDGDLPRYGLDSGPAGMTVHAVTGLVTWRTTPEDVGLHEAVISVRDCCGGVAQLPLSLDVLPDEEAPEAAVGLESGEIDVGELITVSASGSDNVAVTTRQLVVECPPEPPREIPLDALGRAEFASSRVGYCTFTATITDPSGNSTSAMRTLQVGDPAAPLDAFPPVVEVLSPEPGSVVTSLTQVVASISDDTPDGEPGSSPLAWTVEFAPAGSGDFELIGEGVVGKGDGQGAAGKGAGKGAGEGARDVENALLAHFDPTPLANGAYLMRIVGNDGVQTGGVEFEFHVAGELKLGTFTTSFVDLVVPLEGVPIVVSRRYDSTDESPGDFGAGWKLGLPGDVEDTARESDTGNALVDLLANQAFSPGTRAYVTLSDGRRVGFTFAPRSAGGLLAMFYHPHFEPDPGVRETLQVVEPGGSFFLFGGVANQVGIPYNPTKFELTTPEGIAYTMHEIGGLELIEDIEGNTIEVRPDGLFHSTGVAVTFERDPEGRITRITEPRDETPGAPEPGEVGYTYDALGNLVTVRDQSGAETYYSYENESFPNRLTRIEGANGTIATVLDEDGRIVAQCGAGGDLDTLQGCTTFDYDIAGGVQTTFDARGERRDFFFDERGNMLLERVHFQDGTTLDSELEWDEDDQIVSWAVSGAVPWTYEYDGLGNLTRIVDPLGRAREFTYNDCDRVETETDPLGDVMIFSYDDDCNLIASTSPLGLTTEYRRDEDGALVAIVDAEGESWDINETSRGIVTDVTDPRGGSTRTTVNSSGQLTSVVDRNGHRIDFEYEGQLLVSETWDTDPPRTMSYEYDDFGRLSRIEDPDSIIAVDYDAGGRIARIDNDGTPGAPRVILDYEYDGNGNVTAVRDSLGGATIYLYDEMGRPSSIEQSGSDLQEKRVDVVYNRSSQLAEILRFADLAGGAMAARTTVSHEAAGLTMRVTGLHHFDAGGGLIGGIDLERDGAGNVTHMHDEEGAHAYTYDALGGVLSASHPDSGPQPDESYLYDGAGNRMTSQLSATHVLGADLGEGGHTLRQDDRFDYEYDAEGNLTRRSNRSDGSYTMYEWDYRNRLVGVDVFDGTGSPVAKRDYTYDALDRRFAVSDGVETVYSVFDGENPILELDASGAVLARRLYDRNMDGIFAEERAGVTRWLLGDQVGSVRDVVASDGSLLAHYVYDSFGRRLASSGPDPTDVFGFHARTHDDEVGLVHFRARDYDPETGRFISEDPLEPHRYVFALNNPLVLNDPTGRGVAIEYACLAVNAAFVGYAFGSNIALPVRDLFLNIAEAIRTLTPPPGNGGVGAVGNGIASYLGGMLPPTSPSGAAELAGKFALGLACASNGAQADAAKAQGKASGSVPSGGSWTGPSWVKY